MVLRPDKGSGIVLINRADYVNKVESLLSDTNKFKLLNEDVLKVLFKLEDRLNRFLKTLKDTNVINDNSYNNMFQVAHNLA